MKIKNYKLKIISYGILILIISSLLILVFNQTRHIEVDAATFNSSLFPGSDNIYDLGFDSSPKWKDASFSNNLFVNGNVGIGTTTPNDKLTVVDGNISQTLSSTTLTQIGSLDMPERINSVVISGKYAYLYSFANNNGFRIIDISNPTEPIEVGSLDLPYINSSRNGLAVSGKYAYLVNNLSLNIIDISNPTALKIIGSATMPYYTNSIAISGKYAYIGLLSTSTIPNLPEFNIVDISNPTTPKITGQLDIIPNPSISNTYVSSIYILGRYAYVGLFNQNPEFRIIDIANPEKPIEVGNRDISGAINSIYVSGRYAYIGISANNGFQIIDISNPSSPSFVNSIWTGISTAGISIYISGKYAFVATNINLLIIDTLNPLTLKIVANFNAPTLINSIFVSGKYAYIGLSSTSNEFRIYDISGIESVSANIHSLEAGNLQVRNDIIAQGQLQVSGGINVGTGGIFSAGPIGISIASTTQIDAISAYFQGRVGIATTTPTQKLEVNGGIRIFTGDAKSACNATSTRGTLWFTASSSAPENKDTFEVCAKDSGNTYNWRTLY